MLQNLAPFIHKLNSLDMLAQIETSGSVCRMSEDEMDILFGAPDRNVVVCSPKTKRVHKLIERHCRTWKYIIHEGHISDGDGLPTDSIQSGVNPMGIYRPPTLHTHPEGILVQPMDYEEFKTLPAMLGSPHTLAAVRVARQYGYRLSLQLHKLLGLP